MDEETFFAYEEYAQPFSSTYRQKLAALLEKEAYHPFHRLIRLMLEKGKRLEQEAVSKIRLPKQQ
ncbi:hypothetical protein KKC1_23450 [Calderihabitans maritimus]|uniref:Wadjet protein JetD C-terminal domain-containing protein n=2 Tax=Calderihabitans maritimus TaxID=1246530 RepID=A0A1Z5HUJ1_9FIRM|nr:hypothetical protein KKC1_23450 [Calderihabitans maritimus]